MPPLRGSNRIEYFGPRGLAPTAIICRPYGAQRGWCIITLYFFTFTKLLNELFYFRK